jgi:thiamine biosynthesis lipoprotein
MTTESPTTWRQGEIGPVLCGWPVWGTRLTLGVIRATHLHPARLLLEEWVAAVDAACNRFRPDSDIARCNDSAGEWCRVGPTFVAALEVALDAAAGTAGAVDPTVGAALLSLGYDRDFDELVTQPASPAGDPVPLRFAPVAGWRQIELDREGQRVRIPPGAALDLGATAKAWCVDRSVEAIARLGAGVMVDIGGDLAVAGDVPPGGWRIAVQESSRVELDSDAPVVAVSQGGMASSGTTVRRWVHDGRTVHHVIDPRTGRPARPTWRMVTVAAPSCFEANTAATAAVVNSYSAMATLARSGLSARLVGADGRVRTVGGWPEDAAATMAASGSPPAPGSDTHVHAELTALGAG